MKLDKIMYYRKHTNILKNKKRRFYMNIRKLNEDDTEKYQALRLIALKKSPEAFGSTFEREKNFTLETVKQRILSTETKFTLGAFDKKNALMGTVLFVRDSNIKMQHKGSILGLYVSPDSRGQGVAKSLLNKVIEVARRWNGVEQINLTVVSSNLFAKKIYSDLGFEVFGTEMKAMKYDNQYYNEDMMVLFL
ncbi:GNAT family N-acetyltransferase [Carnobacterium inhibens]|uniref:GNAT family N-acetyltransferase n=1 Tax=Carnobacterium inhibens TaxID=147709 RepID=UPI001B800487|nr:GNAT family N-acetyltransferase [Carnobacterium inhibens]